MAANLMTPSDAWPEFPDATTPAGDPEPVEAGPPPWGVIESGKVAHLDVDLALRVAEGQGDDGSTSKSAAILVVEAYRRGIAMGRGMK